jgi:hypothetical protein
MVMGVCCGGRRRGKSCTLQAARCKLYAERYHLKYNISAIRAVLAFLPHPGSIANRKGGAAIAILMAVSFWGLRTSNLVLPTSYFQLRTSNFVLPTSYFQFRTSDFWLLFLVHFNPSPTFGSYLENQSTKLVRILT